MGFKREKPKEEVIEPKLSKTELIQLEKDIKYWGGRQKWLIHKNAIKIDEKGNIIVIYSPKNGLIYPKLLKQLEELDEYIEKRNYAEKMAIFRQTGEMPKDDRLINFKNNLLKLKDNIAVQKE